MAECERIPNVEGQRRRRAGKKRRRCSVECLFREHAVECPPTYTMRPSTARIQIHPSRPRISNSIAWTTTLVALLLHCSFYTTFTFPVSAFQSPRRPVHRTPTAQRAASTSSSSSQSHAPTKSPASTSTTTTTASNALDGLSKFHRSILSRTADRQRLVTGRYPVILSVATDHPTRKWLNLGRSRTRKNINHKHHHTSVRATTTTTTTNTAWSDTELHVNGTAPSRSLASLDRFQWLDDRERIWQQDTYGMVSWEFLAEIHTDRPGYVHILTADGAGSTAATAHKEASLSSVSSFRGPVAATATSSSLSLSSWNQKALAAWQRGGSGMSNAWDDMDTDRNEDDSWGHTDHDSAPSASATQLHTNTNGANTHAGAAASDRDGIDTTNAAGAGDRLWVTSFRLTGRQGQMTAVDCDTCAIRSVCDDTRTTMAWPNEVQAVPRTLVVRQQPQTRRQHERDTTQSMDMASVAWRDDTRDHTVSPFSSPSPHHDEYQDALLVCDGFLVPTKDRGGVYVIRNPGHETEHSVSLTPVGERWFYHRAVWIDLTGDGRQSILTARCQVSTVLSGDSYYDDDTAASHTAMVGDGMLTSGVTKSGELVWLECPSPHSVDPATQTPLERDGSVFDPFHARHLPWKMRVLSTGPDVMFAVAEMETADDSTIQVIASEFFQKRVTVHSVQRGPKPQTIFRRTLDEHCGSAFGCILSNLDGTVSGSNNTSKISKETREVVDSGSTVEYLQSGDYFSHLLVTSHECTYVADTDATDGKTVPEKPSLTPDIVTEGNTSHISSPSPEGGSLFAYRIPDGKDAWKTKAWERTVVASGFKVDGKLNNMINPGAPGFPYVFHAKKSDAAMGKRPLIAVAGDCAESAYIFRPEKSNGLQVHHSTANGKDPSTRYQLMVEIKCQSTVGSIGIGYDDFGSVDQSSGYAKVYVPCYEKDRIMVFGLGSGDDDDEYDDTDGW